jgi:membrane-associated protein
MRYRVFITFNVLGALAWIWSMLLIGYFLARQFPIVGNHIEGLVVVVVAVSISPAIIAWIRSRYIPKATP